MNRRGFLSASAMTAAGTIAALRASPARAQPSAPPKGPSRSERLAEALMKNRMPVAFDGTGFSGAGYDWLLQRGSEAQAFLLGEEHGIAENPKLAAQLFRELVPSGYRRLAIEISPPMAAALDRAMIGGGPMALNRMLTTPGSQVAFFGMREEAEFLAAARAAVPRSQSLLWGLDYEVGADRYLISQLKRRAKPSAAASALAALEAASTASWAKYAATKNPQFIYSFSGDPKLVQAVRAAWPRADRDTRLMLDTLEQTFAINAAWVAGKGYESNLLRSRFLRANLLHYWEREKVANPPARVFMKFGASHMVRGLSMTDVFDVGNLVPELAAADGRTSFHLLVLAGAGRPTANLDPTTFRYVPGNRNQYGAGAEAFHAATLPGGFTVFDTAPLRSIAKSTDRDLHPELVRAIHGFDAVLVFTGSTPSSNL